MVSFFACTCPNWSGVGSIDNPDRFEQVFDQYDIPEALKIFKDDFLVVSRRKMFIFGFLTAFKSNCAEEVYRLDGPPNRLHGQK